MQRVFKIAPSILSADFAQLGDEIRRVEHGADLIHIDVMDGHFVPNISIGIPVLAAIRRITKLPMDVHLMIEKPQRFLESFVDAGADSISVHAEVCDNIPEMAKRIRDLGVRASVAINPETAADRLMAAAEHLDMILVMTVHPGFGGQEFIPQSVARLRAIHEELDRRGLEIDVEVDGGIKVDNIATVAKAGANVFVSGSGIFGQCDYGATIARMRRNIVDTRC